MKPGRYGIELYMTPGTVEVTSAADGETDQIGFTPAINFNHPGNNQEVREFKANHINTKFIAVVRYCSGKDSDLIGSLCNPRRLTPSYTGNQDSNVNAFTLTQISKGDDIKIYKGTLPLESPVAAIAAASTTVAVTSDGRYQLQSGEAAINSITGGADGSVITLVGTTGVAPTVANTDGKILLRGGKAWSGVDGALLTLKAFDNGKANLLWIEQSRYIPS